MSATGNVVKLGTAHSNIQTAQSCPSLVGNETYTALARILLSQRVIPTCQLYKKQGLMILDPIHLRFSQNSSVSKHIFLKLILEVTL